MQWLSQRFELSHGSDGRDIRPMEGLRGFAVFLVFLVHYVSLMQPWLPSEGPLRGLADSLHTVGNAGVDLFFVLSGYLIYGSLIARDQPFLRFMGRRVQRLYPAFSVVFGIYCVISLAMPAYAKIPSPASEGAWYLLQNFLLLPGIFPIEPLITVAWSLSYEMAYYLVMPPLILLLGLRRRRVSVRLGVFVALAALMLVLCAYKGGPVRLVMFVAGILLYEVMAGRLIRAPGSWVGLAALAAGLLFLLVPTEGPAGYALKVLVLFVSFFTLCHVCIGASGAWLARVFTWTPLRWLGNMSYSYYLVHGLALKACVIALAFLLAPGARGALFFAAMLVPMFVMTLLPSALLFLAVERPFSLAPRRHALQQRPAARAA